MATKARSKASKVSEAYVSLLIHYITKQMGCARRDECVRLYGEDVITRAVELGKAKTATIVWTDKTNTVPPQRISVIITSQWSKTKPIWLDEYGEHLRQQQRAASCVG